MEQTFTGRCPEALMRIIAGLLALCAVSCRGRDYAKPMPPFKAATNDTLLVFRSANENYEPRYRIHFVDPGTGEATELAAQPEANPADLTSGPNIAYGSYLIGNRGKHAHLISAAEQRSGKVESHGTSHLSPDGTKYLRQRIGNIFVGKTGAGTLLELKGELADCQWLNNSAIVCLIGPYQQRRSIVRYNLGGQALVLYRTAGPEKFENLRLYPDKSGAAFTENLRDRVKIRALKFADNSLRTIQDFEGRYIFDMAVSAQGTIAAKIVKSKAADDTLEPYDIWISDAFGPAKSAGLLFNLKALASPGFFSGKGFTGVESFAFSPDGQRLAVLMSGEDDCRMVDEGGNLGCRKDIYIVERDNPRERRLTRFAIQSAEKLEWLDFGSKRPN